MPPSSTISITYDGIDITEFVLFNSARFECQTNAVPGQCSFIVKDEDRSQFFEVGKEVYLYVDDIKMFGGIVMRVGRQLALPVDDTTTLSSVKTRQWVIEALDFNIWFDKRVIRDTSNYLEAILLDAPQYDGAIIRNELPNYIDVPPGVNMTTYVQNIKQCRGDEAGKYGLAQQGSKWRDQMDLLAALSAAVYYIDADKFLHFESLQTATKDWAFVDHAPNGTTRVPCREVSATQDGSMIVNDALVWGGLEVEGQVYFAREQDASAQDTYGRWQLGELHFNEGMDQQAVTERADAIINGPPGTSGDVQGGLRFPLWRVHLTWYAHDVPRDGGEPDHIRPGNLVNIMLYTMGENGNALPLFLPLLNMSVTFPQLAGNAESWVRFDGEFGLSYADSRFLWHYILNKKSSRSAPLVVGAVGNASAGSGFADFGTFVPNEAPDGLRTTFTFPFPLLHSTIRVFINGLRWRENYEYSVTSTNEIRLFSPLASDDKMYVEARTGTG